MLALEGLPYTWKTILCHTRVLRALSLKANTGVSFAFLQLPIIIPVAVIGIVTSLLSFLGVSFGNTLGHLFGSRVETAGGLILMAIGLKILLEHLI